MDHSIEPHVGKLVELLVDEERKRVLKDLSLRLSSMTLSEPQMCDLELLLCGAFSPSQGFMARPDYESVMDRMRLQDNRLWPMPVCLDIK